MWKWLILLISLIQATTWTQEVEILIVYSNQDDNRPIIHEEVWLINNSDTLIKRTNVEGIAFFSSKDSLQPIAANSIYEIFIPKEHLYNEGWLIEVDFINTTCTTNTRFIRDYRHMIVCKRINQYPKIPFEMSSAIINSNEIIATFNFLEENEHLTIELIGEFDSKTPTNLALNRATNLRDSLIILGINADRLFIGKPSKKNLQDSTLTGVTYSIMSTNYYPCTGLSVINFKKYTDTIIETRCDSLKFMYSEIMSTNDTYALIGIYHFDDHDHVISDFAMDRAEIVKQELIKLGVPDERLEVFTQYYPEPAENDYRDWPFYPLNYTYEIGVVLNLAP